MCIYIYIYKYHHTCIKAHIITRIQIHIITHIHIHIHNITCVYIYSKTHKVHTHTYIYTRIYIVYTHKCTPSRTSFTSAMSMLGSPSSPPYSTWHGNPKCCSAATTCACVYYMYRYLCIGVCLYVGIGVDVCIGVCVHAGTGICIGV